MSEILPTKTMQTGVIINLVPAFSRMLVLGAIFTTAFASENTQNAKHRLAINFNDAMNRCIASGSANIEEVIGFFSNDATYLDESSKLWSGKAQIRQRISKATYDAGTSDRIEGIEVAGTMITLRLERRRIFKSGKFDAAQVNPHLQVLIIENGLITRLISVIPPEDKKKELGSSFSEPPRNKMEVLPEPSKSDSVRQSSFDSFRDAILSESVYKALYEVLPDKVDAAIRSAHARFKSGLPIPEAFMDLNILLRDAVAQRWSQASDAALDLLIDYNIRLIEDNYQQNPKNVLLRLNDPAAQAWHSSELESKLPNYPRKLSLRLYEEVLKSKGEKVSDSTLKMGELMFGRIVAEVLPEGGLQLISQIPHPSNPADHQRACEMYLLLYKAVKVNMLRHEVAKFILAP